MVYNAQNLWVYGRPSSINPVILSILCKISQFLDLKQTTETFMMRSLHDSYGNAISVHLSDHLHVSNQEQPTNFEEI
jgi:phosphopantetheine adenylyltransferase